MFTRQLVMAVGLAGLLSMTGAPAQADTTVEAELEESNDSGVSGTAQLTATPAAA